MLGTEDLGLSTDEWRRLTPRLLAARLHRHRKISHADDLRFGVVAAAVYNVHRRKGRKPLGPEDLFPDPDAPPRQVSRETMKQKVKDFNAFLEARRS